MIIIINKSHKVKYKRVIQLFRILIIHFKYIEMIISKLISFKEEGTVFNFFIKMIIMIR
jgi:hypothetical protein